MTRALLLSRAMWLLAFACFLAAWLLVSSVFAQRRNLDVISLARVCASEAGLTATEDECAAIAAVLRSRCAECRLETSARQYSSGVFNTARTDARAWIAHLREDAREPHRWPSNASWQSARDRWLRLLGIAERIVRGDLEHRCELPPRHWGGSVDRARAARMRLVRVDCGETRNDFYVLPRDDAVQRAR